MTRVAALLLALTSCSGDIGPEPFRCDDHGYAMTNSADTQDRQIEALSANIQLRSLRQRAAAGEPWLMSAKLEKAEVCP